MSRVLRRLEAEGLVRRVADPTDDRAVVVALTWQGREAGARIVEAARILNRPVADAWSAQDEQDLSRLLVKLARALDASPQHPLSSAAGVVLDP